MPFERYLRDHPVNSASDYTYYDQDRKNAFDDADCHLQHPYPSENTHDHRHPHAVHFQIPQFMLNGPPILAPGGGAEVFPAGLLDSSPDSLASSCFHSALISRQIASRSTPSDSASTSSYNSFLPDASQRLQPTFPPRFSTSVNPQQQPLPGLPPSFDVATNFLPDLAPSPSSAGTSNSTSYAFRNDLAADPASFDPAPSPALGLPVYSASGFDVLSILSRVVNRPNPIIQLGPVDLSCSFVIVDIRRHDCPIVYASPTFSHLTGYSEQEVLGRNCRFLQSPTGQVVKGELRRFTSSEGVSHMRKLLSSSKECQTRLINYRKGGKPFVNLVTVIPLRGGVHNTPNEAEEVVYHIGFQVDLTEQPTRIMDKLHDRCCYSVNNYSWETNSFSDNGGLPTIGHGSSQLPQSQDIGPKGGKHGRMMSIAVSKELRDLIADTTFTDSVSISTGTNMSGPTGAPSGSTDQGSKATTPLTAFVAPPSNSSSMNRMSAVSNTMTGSIPVSLSPSLSLLLLEFLPDFVLVLSLKGAFLYVAPSVRLVLGYEPQELVGKSISDVCHPADLVPLMRELKEGSVSGLGVSGSGDAGSSTGTALNVLPKSVDLLFRALPKVQTVSPSKDDRSAEKSSFRSSQMPSMSTAQSPSSSGVLCASDPSDRTSLPYVWLECRGRLHVEPGKGRKAIILSGRARWMPVVRWSSVDKAGGIGDFRCRGEDAHRMTTGSSVGMAPLDHLEFWALLSTQGTFLVASASVRDVLGWGTGEMIGRNIWALVRDNQKDMREHVEAELGKLDAPEAGDMVDPPPTIITTSLVHKDLHVVPMRLVFYRTPRAHKRAPPLTSPSRTTSTPLIHPLNTPLCPIVCQATLLSNAGYESNNNVDTTFGAHPGHTPDQARIQVGRGDDKDAPDPTVNLSGASLFEELEVSRGTSWQYELQQLKFANQRLHEELHALEGARETNKAETGSSSAKMGHVTTVPLSQSHQPLSATEISTSQQLQLPQSPPHYTPLMESTLRASMPALRLPNSLHEQDPPSSEWSSLTGANGQCPNPLKRSWYSEDGPTT